MEKENVVEFEKCILCGKTTNVFSNVPIECRKNYILGCGQLCDQCASNIKIEYGEDE